MAGSTSSGSTTAVAEAAATRPSRLGREHLPAKFWAKGLTRARGALKLASESIRPSASEPGDQGMHQGLPRARSGDRNATLVQRKKWVIADCYCRERPQPQKDRERQEDQRPRFHEQAPDVAPHRSSIAAMVAGAIAAIANLVQFSLLF